MRGSRIWPPCVWPENIRLTDLPAGWRRRLSAQSGAWQRRTIGSLETLRMDSGMALSGLRNALDRIVDAGKPEPAAAAFDGQIGVVEHGDAVGGERLSDLARVRPGRRGCRERHSGA